MSNEELVIADPGEFDPDAETLGRVADSPVVNSAAQVFGDYELISEIARGGMGVVYKARHAKLNRIVALKMMLSEHLATADDVKRFLSEAEAAASLQHTGIVPVFEVGQHEGQHFFAMAFIEGETLARRIKRATVSPETAANLLLKISEAVKYAHEQGVIHRDLKPANILLDQHDTPKITDFGLAKRIDGDCDLTRAGQIIGTPSYMAPEQVKGSDSVVSPSMDIYALGATLYCCLTGRPPFQSSNMLDTLFEVMENEPIPPRAIVPDIPRDLESVCLKCLAKDLGKRYSSASELIDDLRRFMAGEPVQAVALSGFRKVFVWFRNRPALLITWVCLSALYVNHLFFAHVLRLPDHQGWFAQFATSIIVLWAAVAYLFQTGLVRNPESLWIRIAWPTAEVAFVFTFLLFSNGLQSALTPAFFVLIANAGLRRPVEMIWYVTACCILAYLALQFHALMFCPDQSVTLATAVPAIIFMSALALIQFTLVRQRTKVPQQSAQDGF